MEAQRDPAFRAILNSSLLTTPDGRPTVWIGKLGGHSDMDQVRGADLMQAVCAISPKRGYRHFLYGGREGIAEKLKGVCRTPPGIENSRNLHATL